MCSEILIIIQCRYNSRRLPGKALLPFANTNVLGFLIRRLQWGLKETGWKIILATTKRQDDDTVARTAKKLGLIVVRGEEADVLARFGRCMDLWPTTQTLVRITADNPLTCPHSVRSIVQVLQDQQADYAACRGFPYGATADVFSRAALSNLLKKAFRLEEREHINKYILDHSDDFNLHWVDAQGLQARPELSLTVDTEYDLLKLRRLFSSSENHPWEITLNEAIARMDRYALC